MHLRVGAVAKDVLRNDGRERSRHGQKQGRVGLRQAHHGRAFVVDGHRVDRPVHRAEGVVVADRLDGELHVFGRDGLAVVEDGEIGRAHV